LTSAAFAALSSLREFKHFQSVLALEFLEVIERTWLPAFSALPSSLVVSPVAAPPARFGNKTV
jgi:hypothetical protein